MSGRVALVTGAAGAGIGQAVARRLGQEGASVILVDSHERRLESVAQSMGSEVTDRLYAWAVDVADRDAVDRVIQAIGENLGPVDILVNNAAINALESPVDMDPDEFDRVLSVDLAAPWYLSRAVLPGMIRLGRGSIVNISSVVAWTGSAVLASDDASFITGETINVSGGWLMRP